ncbi:TPA: tape measure protein [Escherichia coli]|nr:tape measure protein [Escherichia coli]HAW5290816.1 tape measure protein [Escherichia coli]
MATLRELIIKISANSRSFQSEISRASRMGQDYYRTMQNGGRQSAAASREMRRALAEVTDQINTAKSSALNMAGAFAGAFATGHLISLADEWNSVNARLKQASQSSDDFQSSQRELMAISQRTGTAFSDNASLFARSAASMREYGYSSEEVLKVTEAISTGLKLSGASTAEASSVITQFSQALAQGVLRGEEFNSVNENGDRVIRALAAGMGVARKDLKAMADNGKLTADKVVPALISQLGALRDEYLGTALYWIAASINIKPGHDYYFYVRSVNTVGKSAFVEAVGQPSDDASGYLDFFKGEIGKTHLAQELWTQIDNGQLAPDLTEIRTSITDVSNEITQTVNKKLEDQSAAIQQIQKVQVDTNNNLNSMWAVKLQQMQDGRLYIAGIGAGIENTPDGMQSQVLLAADRIAMINPANGNTKPMFVGQGDQIFMNEVFLKRLTAPTITSGGSPPVFSLTSDGKLTAKNADISGSVNANSGTLNNVTINQNCTIKGMLEATQVRGDFVKAVSKAFPKKVGTWGNTETPNGTVTVTISDDHNFDRQIIIPPIIFNGIAYSDPGSGNNPGGTRYTGYGFEVRKNGVLIASRETKGAISQVTQCYDSPPVQAGFFVG